MKFQHCPAFVGIIALLASACSTGVATIAGVGGHTATGTSGAAASGRDAAGAVAAEGGARAGAAGVATAGSGGARAGGASGVATAGSGGAQAQAGAGGSQCGNPPCAPGNEVNQATCRCEPKGGSGAAGSDVDDGGTAGAKSCPQECLRAYTCAATCNDTPVNNGCCPCPAGTIDTITCDNTATGHCGIPCTGAAPDPKVVSACQGIKTFADCSAYTSNAFPYHCAWLVPPTPACLVP